MALTETGLTIPRLEELIDSQGRDLRQQLGVNIDLSEDSVAGIINSIYSNALSDAYELLQAIYEARDLYKARGYQLEILATYLGTSRIRSAASRVNALFIGDNGTTIPQGFVASIDPQGDRFLSESSYSITNLSCYYATISIEEAVDSFDYTVSVDGSSYTYTSGVGESLTDIADGILTELQTGIGFTATKNGAQITVTAPISDFDQPEASTLRVDIDAELTFSEVASFGNLVSEETGGIPAIADSLTVIETPVAGLTSITNPEDGQIGRNAETDDELRNRLIDSKSRSSAATFDAVSSRLLDLDNVESANILENITYAVDVNGLPPKSYEVIVVGGLDSEVGQAIWDTKPAGIETHGNTSVVVKDFAGNFKSVNFTRPNQIEIYVKIEYTKYAEETFPIGGEQAILDAILERGNALRSGQDVIPRKFIGGAYDATSGLEDVFIYMSTSPNPTLDDAIPINLNEEADFDSSRITIAEI